MSSREWHGLARGLQAIHFGHTTEQERLGRPIPAPTLAASPEKAHPFQNLHTALG